MEEGGGTAGLPVVDTTNIVKGSADGTKLMRFEVDGITTGTTRVMTVPDKNITLCDTAEVMLLSGIQAMAAAIDMGNHDLDDCGGIYGGSILTLQGGRVLLYADSHITYPGLVLFAVPDAAITSHVSAMGITGVTDTPIVDIYHGLDMNGKNVDDIGALILNDATELTILANVVTATQSYHTIDTESDGASDDLEIIFGGTAGQELTIRAVDSTRTVVCKDGTGNLRLSADMTLDHTEDTLTMIYDGTNWLETGRSNNST